MFLAFVFCLNSFKRIIFFQKEKREKEGYRILSCALMLHYEIESKVTIKNKEGDCNRENDWSRTPEIEKRIYGCIQFVCLFVHVCLCFV